MRFVSVAAATGLLSVATAQANQVWHFTYISRLESKTNMALTRPRTFLTSVCCKLLVLL